MKEIKEKKHLIIGITTIVGAFLAIFVLFYKPTSEQKSELVKEISLITVEDLSALENQLQSEKETNEDVKKELDKIYQQKNFGYLTYTQIMSYVGEKADEYGVEVIAVDKAESRKNGVHYEVPYYLDIQGEYENILMFVDSLYQLENYMEVAEIKITQKEIAAQSPNTTQNTNGTTDPNTQQNGTTDSNTQQNGTINPNTQQNGTTDPNTQQNGTTDPNTQQNGTTITSNQNNNAISYPQWMQVFSKKLDEEIAESLEVKGLKNTQEVKKYYDDYIKEKENSPKKLSMQLELFFITMHEVTE